MLPEGTVAIPSVNLALPIIETHYASLPFRPLKLKAGMVIGSWTKWVANPGKNTGFCFDNYIDVDLDMPIVEADHHSKISQQL